MPRIVTVLCLLIIAEAVSAQAPGVQANYADLARQSSTVIIGTVSHTRWVIRPDRRISRTSQLPNGQRTMEIQNPSEYVIGRSVRLRVSEVLKGGAKVKAGGTINIFELGRFPTEGAAILADRQKYAVFLIPLKPGGDEFAGTVVYQPGERRGGEPRFAPEAHYVVIGGVHGAVPVEPEKRKVINRIRAAVRR